MNNQNEGYDFNKAYARANSIFPYRVNGEPNPNEAQIEIMKHVLALKEPGGTIISASTGSGKTAAVLTSLIARADLSKQKIVVFVRTITQMDPIIREWSRIIGGYSGLKNKNAPRILPMKGKNKLCKQLPILEKHGSIDKSCVGMLCEAIGCRLWPRNDNHSALGKKPARIILEKLNAKLAGIVDNSTRSPISAVDELYAESPSCGYYDQKDMIKYANIVVVTYAHMRQPQLSVLLKQMGKEMADLYILVDEAHNLINKKETEVTIDDVKKVESLIGPTILTKKLKKIMKMNKNMTPKEFAKDYEWESTMDVLNTMKQSDLEAMNMSKWDMMTPEIVNMKSFINSRNHGFITSSKGSVRIVEVTPAKMLSQFSEASIIIFQSGTIQPITEFKKMFGLDHLDHIDTIKEGVQNKMKTYLKTRGLTSKMKSRGPKLYKMMARTIIEMHKLSPRHTLVICPSYDFKEQIFENIKKKYNPEKIVNEQRKSTTKELTKDVKYAKQSKIILGVSGGKISEGVEVVRDSRSLISMVIMAGMAFRPPSKDKIAQKREMILATKSKTSVEQFQTSIPLVQDIEQSFGRSVRTMNDRGVLIIMDYRAERIQKDMKLQKYSNVEKLKNDVRSFFDGYKPISSI